MYQLKTLKRREAKHQGSSLTKFQSFNFSLEK